MTKLTRFRNLLFCAQQGSQEPFGHERFDKLTVPSTVEGLRAEWLAPPLPRDYWRAELCDASAARRVPRRLGRIAACVGAIVLLAVGAARATPNDEALEAAWAADRLDAVANLRAVAAVAEQCRTATTGQVVAIEATSATIKAELAGLQKQLLSVLAKDDPAALRVIRARLSARQSALDAAEGEMALILKQADEADRERDVWKKRAASLELALRMDMKTMLAGPAEIEDRDRRVDAAEKEIETQEAQIRKFAARREAVVSRREILRRRLAELTASVGDGLSAELRCAQNDEAGQLRRSIAQQEEWFRLNRLLEVRARRNLAFARADELISRRFAEALAHKADARRANEFQAAAERGDAQLALLRAAVAPWQQGIATNLSAATGEADAALRSIGEARTAQDETQAHAAYAQAQARKGRWEAENDCWKEYLALQKAGAAFAHELADRARCLAEDRNIADINQEEEQLRASLVTSEQYVRTLDLQLQKLDAQIESANLDLGLGPQQAAELAAPWADLFASYDAGHPPAPALVADLLGSLAGRLPDGESSGPVRLERRRAMGAILVAHSAQREMLRVRKGISERWLENSREAIRTLEQLAGRQLWQQHDPRLNAVTCRETLSLAGAVADSAGFAWDCWSHRIGGLSDVPGLRRVLTGIGLILLAWLAGWLASRTISDGSRLRRLVRKLAVTFPPLAVAAMLAVAAGRDGGLAVRWLGCFLPALAGWVLIRNLLLVGTRDHRAPSGATVGGALLAAMDTILLWSAMLWPCDRIAGTAANAWDTQAVLARLWLFGVCLALFRLAMHPFFAGRFLSRRSANRGLRGLGDLAAIACMLVAALVALTYLAGLDNLGRSVLHAAEGTFAALAAALVVAAILGRLTRRHAAGSGMVWALVRVAQLAVLLVAAAGVAWIWWLLLNRAVLANNAPPPVPEIVQAVARGLLTLVDIWRFNLATGVTVGSMTRGLAVVAISFWVARQVKSVMLRRVLARTPMDEATRLTFAGVSGWLVILLGFLVGMNVAGSSLQNLALLAGAITVGVGFGLQNVINNFVSSLLIHFSRSIRVGDYIEVGDIRGTVREIGMRNTVLVTDDEITVLVPNGSFITGNIVNWTNPTRRIRLHVPVVVVRQANLTIVAELAVAEAVRHPLVVKQPAPVLEVRTVTATQVSMDLLVWSEHPEKANCIVGDISLTLDRVLREKGFAA
jgi:small-conductance mechanosensitive channel